MPYSSRTYLIYVDDSGNENVGWLWTALALPTELWTDHLRRWLYRARFEIFEKAIKTIGSFPDARLFTTYTPTATGAAKLALYDDLLCFLEDFLIRERSHGMLVVDGLQDNGGHLRASHRALSIAKRRVVEGASHRRSSDSQLLQMADCCAYAALQSIQAKATMDIRFRASSTSDLSLGSSPDQPMSKPGVASADSTIRLTRRDAQASARLPLPRLEKQQAPVSQGLSQEGPRSRLNRRAARTPI